MDQPDLGFEHRYVPPRQAGVQDGVTLMLLHGTGGDENDLIPLGEQLLPGAGMLSPRGRVLEHGMPRFFRRLAEGVFDLEDLARRTDELAAFIQSAAQRYGFEASRLVAAGFSNGANIAASVVLRRPGQIRAAILLSPMLPFEPPQPIDLAGTRVFIGAGRADTMIPPARAQRLADVLRESGAAVTEHWHPSGHTVTADELAAARAWLTNYATSLRR